MPDERFIMGIDPGKTGGVAVLRQAGNEFLISEAIRMPVSRRGIDVRALDDLYTENKPEIVVLERQVILPRDGRSTGGETMRLYGMLMGWCCLRHGEPLEAWPAAWKKACGLTSDKELSRSEATRLFPDDADKWRFKKDDGVAEAVLLARYIGLITPSEAGSARFGR